MWDIYLPLTRKVLPLLRAPDALVIVVALTHELHTYVHRSPAISLSTANSATALVCSMLVHIFACDGKPQKWKPQKFYCMGFYRILRK